LFDFAMQIERQRKAKEKACKEKAEKLKAEIRRWQMGHRENLKF